MDGADLTTRKRACCYDEFQTIVAWYLSRASGISRRKEGMKLKKIITRTVTRKKTALLLLSLMAMLVIPATTVGPKAMGATGRSFDNLVVILMENNGYCDVMTSCGGSGSYETSLAQTYSIAGSCQSDSSCSSGGYSGTSHPSEGNYISLVGGDNFGHTSDGYCCWGLAQSSIVAKMESSGLTWQAYAEDASGSGSCSFDPPRHADHFGFLTFNEMHTSARCSHFLATTSPSNPSGSADDHEFLGSLNAPNPANMTWLTPNDNDNGHDSGVSGGDSYLSNLVPLILSSNLFKTHRAALFIVYDEGNSGCSPSPCSGSTNDFLYASWSGPVVKQAYVGTGSYNHYSFLKTVETNWGLSSLTSNDANASPMTEFFASTTTTSPPSGNQPASFWTNPLVMPVILGAILTGIVYLVASRRRSATKRRVVQTSETQAK